MRAISAGIALLTVLAALPAVQAGPTLEQVLDPYVPDEKLPDTDKTPAGATVSYVMPDRLENREDGDDAGGDGSDSGPGLGDRLRDAFADEMWMAGLAGTTVSLLSLAAFALVTRYVSPKEALRNPQRSMLFGFIKATPGAHLKQISEEFGMKTSSILWHMRKLEAAELVRSERANGFRVFYPVEGGVEVKKLSRAMTALQNDNARAIHELIDRRPGLAVKEAAERLDVHPGTVRWHLKKLRDFGCVEELVRDDGSLFYPTPLGKKALEALLGAPVSTARTGNTTATPTK